MGDQRQLTDWPVEFIPDPDQLFLRVHTRQLNRGALHPGVFKEQDGSMSTDWEKYSSPEQSRQRAKKPESVGVIALLTGGVRQIPELEVRHSPDVQARNRAHTDIIGIEAEHGFPPAVLKVKIRLQLFELFNDWTIEPAA